MLGLALATAFGWGDGASIALSIALAFFFGYLLTSVPLLRSGLAPRRVAGLAFASDTFSITTMEIIDSLIILAVPTHRFRELPSDLFNGKILVDAMNYWEPVDGTDPELAAAADGTSTVVQQRFASARLVKSLNQLGYHELDEHRHPRGAPDRIAIGSAGDDRAAVAAVMRLIDRLGFDAVDAGPLDNGLALEPDGSPFAVTYNADELAKLLARHACAGP